ncbi:hypothetical protein DYB32_006689 [Aphanomyces invadans]|uniref:Integrase catalytic domain-containing protein n=1 Tax=Aphanomyces invadans TaxID=157072 RepID=A0A418AQS8_9STRA|nr:hypothetical protein DYB32_006689 [Aphanomyces invadans]
MIATWWKRPVKSSLFNEITERFSERDVENLKLRIEDEERRLTEMNQLRHVEKLKSPRTRVVRGFGAADAKAVANFKGKLIVNIKFGLRTNSNVLYFPQSGVSLLSLGVFTQRGYEFKSVGTTGANIMKGNQEFLHFERSGQFYELVGELVVPDRVCAVLDNDIWHRRMVHASVAKLHQLSTSGFAMPDLKGQSHSTCEVCMATNLRRQTFSDKVQSDLPDVVSVDLVFFSVPSRDEFTSALKLVTHDHRLSYVAPLRIKSDTLSAFERFFVYYKAQRSASIKHVKSDGGGEFAGQFKTILEKNGVELHVALRETPQLNGIAERTGYPWFDGPGHAQICQPQHRLLGKSGNTSIPEPAVEEAAMDGDGDATESNTIDADEPPEPEGVKEPTDEAQTDEDPQDAHADDAGEPPNPYADVPCDPHDDDIEKPDEFVDAGQDDDPDVPAPDPQGCAIPYAQVEEEPVRATSTAALLKLPARQDTEVVGILPTASDPCVYVFGDGEAYIVVYVDDLILCARDTVLVPKFEAFMDSMIVIEKLGDLEFRFGVTVSRDCDQMLVYLNQSTFVDQLQDRFDVQGHGLLVLMKLRPEVNDQDVILTKRRIVKWFVPYSISSIVAFAEIVETHRAPLTGNEIA